MIFGESSVILATCTCELILAVRVCHIQTCNLIGSSELSSQQNQETAQRVSDPFPLLSVESAWE